MSPLLSVAEEGTTTFVHADGWSPGWYKIYSNGMATTWGKVDLAKLAKTTQVLEVRFPIVFDDIISVTLEASVPVMVMGKDTNRAKFRIPDHRLGELSFTAFGIWRGLW